MSANVVRLDEGMFTHVKVNGRLYRKDNVVRAVRAYVARLSTRFATSRPVTAPDGTGRDVSGAGKGNQT